MEWCKQSIVEAINLSKANHSIFVVFIDGTDDNSNKLTNIINEKSVSQLLSGKNFVAIKITAGSLEHKQFSEFYKNPVPSICFLDVNGKIMEVVTSFSNANEAVLKLNKLVIQNGGTPEKINDSDVSKEGCGSSSTDTGERQSGIVSDDLNAGGSGTDDGNAGSSSTIEDKLKLAQEIIEKKRQAKREEDEEKDRQKEIERRKLGQDVLKMKRWQQEQEVKQRLEERAREKREETAARDRVRRQIEEDKREKAAKFAAQNANLSNQNRLPAGENIDNIGGATGATSKFCNTARLQLRLPDGGYNTHEFDAHSLLQDVIDYIKSNLNLGFQNFILSTTFPRREFTMNDASMTLMDLNLTPNAVILILPTNTEGTVASQSSGFTAMIWYILTPLLNFFGYLRGLVMGNSSASGVTGVGHGGESYAKREDQEEERDSRVRRRPGESVIRRHGNIHRLSDRDSDNNDDNNTWNGNSTQQM